MVMVQYSRIILSTGPTTSLAVPEDDKVIRGHIMEK